MPNNIVALREATELELTLYWELVDRSTALNKALAADPAGPAHYRAYAAKLKGIADLINKIGFRNTQAGILVEDEVDILDRTSELDILAITSEDYTCALTAMRHGKQGRL